MRGLFCAAALLLAACRPQAPVDFPIGIYGVWTKADAELLAKNGFNAVQPVGVDSGAVASLAVEVGRHGMMSLIPHQGIAGPTFSARAFPGAVWQLQDEPDRYGMSLSEMAGIEKAVRAWAQSGLTAFIVGDGRKAKDYPGVADIIMVDWYPVPHLPLESTGDHVRLTAEVADGRKVWAVLQAMDWRDFPQSRPAMKRIGRFPDEDEIRFMSYDAVLNGAQGLWYYTFSTASSRTLAQTPEHYFAVTAVVSEIRAMAPVFAHGRSIPLPFAPPKAGWLARAWTYHGRDYIVMANRTKDRQWKVPEEALKPTWRPLFEVRRDPRELLTPFEGSYYLKPYQVLVLESRLRPKRFLGL